MDGLKRTRLIEPDTRRLAPQAVKRAVDYMRGNIAENIALADLASACDVSERTLLSQFHRFLGISPMAYLHRVRLNTARAELTEGRSDVAISDIAGRCGLSHLGRFATEYRRLFGETPSATRRRVRARAPQRVTANNRASSCTGHLPLPLAGREKPSLLLLPLHTETLRESSEARDLTERLAVTLSRMSIATVTLARPSSAYSMPARQPRNAGSHYCLLGSLAQRGEHTRVVIRLVDVAADRHIWGDSFDGSVHDPFELQGRVVEGVECGVVSHVMDAEIERARNKSPEDVTARDLALQALPLVLGASVPGAKRAMSILDRALALDPADATSMALLACCHGQLSTYHGTTSPAAARDTALELSRRAGILENNDPLVTTARAAATQLALRCDEADALVARALAMDPTSAWAWERRAFLRVNATDADHADATGWRLHSPVVAELALADFQRALQLKGPGQSRANCFVGIATAHYKAGRRAETELWTQRALAENPEATWIYRWQSCYLSQWHDKSRLMAAVEHWRRAMPECTVSLLLACCPPASPSWLEALAGAGMPVN